MRLIFYGAKLQSGKRMGHSYKLSKNRIKALKAMVLAVMLLACFYHTPKASAHSMSGSCGAVRSHIISEHERIRTEITRHTANEFNSHRDWLVNTFFARQVLPALQLFTEQMSAVAMHQTMTIGMFFDAKNQMETQRLFQELQVQAHKDYQPSTSFCQFGTNVRSLAFSEELARHNAVVNSRRQMARHLGVANMGGSRDSENDKINRWRQFTEFYCDPQDNNWIDGTDDTGLIDSGNASAAHHEICQATDTMRVNMDIDYTRAIENRRSLNLDRRLSTNIADEIDTQALSNNLYGHNILFRSLSQSGVTGGDKPKLYLALRALAAKRSVAENSFNNIVGMRGRGAGQGGGSAMPRTNRYLGAALRQLGMPDAEINQYTSGRNNGHWSYYNQLEILAKKLYQNPDFYANLYDKPANVKRVSAALKAIELMLDRSIYESQLRQEMAMSVLLSSRLRMNFEDVNNNLKN